MASTDRFSRVPGTSPAVWRGRFVKGQTLDAQTNDHRYRILTNPASNATQRLTHGQTWLVAFSVKIGAELIPQRWAKLLSFAFAADVEHETINVDFVGPATTGDTVTDRKLKFTGAYSADGTSGGLVSTFAYTTAALTAGIVYDIVIEAKLEASAGNSPRTRIWFAAQGSPLALVVDNAQANAAATAGALYARLVAGPVFRAAPFSAGNVDLWGSGNPTGTEFTLDWIGPFAFNAASIPTMTHENVRQLLSGARASQAVALESGARVFVHPGYDYDDHGTPLARRALVRTSVDTALHEVGVNGVLGTDSVDRFSKVDDPDIPDAFAWRLRHRSGDPTNAGRNRAEIEQDTSLTGSAALAPGDDVWIGFSIRPPQGNIAANMDAFRLLFTPDAGDAVTQASVLLRLTTARQFMYFVRRATSDAGPVLGYTEDADPWFTLIFPAGTTFWYHFAMRLRLHYNPAQSPSDKVWMAYGQSVAPTLFRDRQRPNLFPSATPNVRAILGMSSAANPHGAADLVMHTKGPYIWNAADNLTLDQSAIIAFLRSAS